MNCKSICFSLLLVLFYSCSNKSIPKGNTPIQNSEIREEVDKKSTYTTNPFNAYNDVNRGMTVEEVVAKFGEPQNRGKLMLHELYHYCQANEFNNFNLTVLFSEGKVVEVQRMISKKTDYPDCKDYYSILEAQTNKRLSRNDLHELLEKNGKVTIATFDSASFDPKPSLNPTQILELVELINANKNGFYIVGHTNNLGSKDKNLTLSIQRASATIKLLEDQYGLEMNKLKATGEGEVNPLFDNDTLEGRMQNSRVEVIINY